MRVTIPVYYEHFILYLLIASLLGSLRSPLAQSLSLVLLSAIPLMSGNKKMRDILPQLTKLDIVGRLASDLIEHVANMLSIHVERASSGVPGVLLPDGVVHGLDLIFNMMSASLDTVVSAEWRGTAEGLLERIRDGVHSLSDYPDEGLQGEISNYSKELRETLNRGDSTKMDVAHLESRMKRRLSTVLGTGETKRHEERSEEPGMGGFEGVTMRSDVALELNAQAAFTPPNSNTASFARRRPRRPPKHR